jgi:hypothetical protein
MGADINDHRVGGNVGREDSPQVGVVLLRAGLPQMGKPGSSLAGIERDCPHFQAGP